MPFFTLTIEDYSPFITYSSDWRPGTSADSSASSYSQSTFRLTNKGGESAKIAFNGTGITIYGAKRPNHGQYLVNVDGQNKSPVNGSSPDQFNQALFTVSDLAQKLHTVQITNQNDGLYLDIDYITIQGNIGASTSGQLYVINYQDSDSKFSYQPDSQWSTSPDNIGTFFGSSGHSTSSSQASFDFSFQVSNLLGPSFTANPACSGCVFNLVNKPRVLNYAEGNGVSLYGPLSTNGAPFTVSLDGAQAISLSSASDRYLPQALLYHATNIGAGQHHLKVTCAPTANNQVFAVDYANVYTDNPDLVPGSSTSSSKGSSGLSAGAAAGIAVAASVIAGLLALLVFLLMRRRKQGKAENKKETSALVDPYPNGSTRAQQGTIVTPSNHVTQFSTSYAPGAATTGYPVPMVSGSTSDYAPVSSDSGASSSNLNPLRHGANPTSPSSDGAVDMYGERPSPAAARKLRMDRTNEISPPGYSM